MTRDEAIRTNLGGIRIFGVWLQATTDTEGKETITVSVKTSPEAGWVEIHSEPGGVVAQQDLGANISHIVAPAGIRRRQIEAAREPVTT